MVAEGAVHLHMPSAHAHQATLPTPPPDRHVISSSLATIRGIPL
jgi:hypothetical protein